MILPSKHLSQEKALLSIGAELLKHLNRPNTVSAVWEHARRTVSISYDWFVLALDLLYAIEAIEIHEGLLMRRTAS
ncbi:MAG: ABC-three component system middle component 6 [Pseudomonadota bacterium]